MPEPRRIGLVGCVKSKLDRPAGLATSTRPDFSEVAVGTSSALHAEIDLWHEPEPGLAYYRARN